MPTDSGADVKEVRDMEKEKAREMVESLEVADVCIVVTGNNRKVTCVTSTKIGRASCRERV